MSSICDVYFVSLYGVLSCEMHLEGTTPALLLEIPPLKNLRVDETARVAQLQAWCLCPWTS